MTRGTGDSPQPWWKKKTGRAVILVLATPIAALIAGIIAGFLGFLLAVVLMPRLGIIWLLPQDKRRFLTFLWSIYALAWGLSSLFFWALSVRVAALPIGWFETILIGSDIPRLVISVIMGLGFALAFTVLPLLTIATVASLWVLAVTRTYGVTRRQAVRLMVSLILKINQPVWIVENGEYKESEPKGWPPKIGGPGLVIIRPYNAVVLEQAGRVTRIEGPGEVRIDLDERIKAVVDLRIQSGGFQAEHVLTRDRVPLKIVGGAGFRLQHTEDVIPRDPNLQTVTDGTRAELSFLIAGRDSQQGSQDASRVMRRSVYNAVYGTKTHENWIDRMKGDAESEIRKVIRTYDFKEIYNLDEAEWDDPEVRETVLEEITRKVTDRLRSSARRYGVHVLGAAIKTIQIEDTENIGKAYFAALGAEWQRRMALKQTEAEGAAFRGRAEIQTEYMVAVNDVLGQFRQALVEMAGAAQPISPDVVERYLQVAERLLQNILTDHSTARRYLETMETLARVSPNTVIAAGVDIANVTHLLTPGLKPAGEDLEARRPNV